MQGKSKTVEELSCQIVNWTNKRFYSSLGYKECFKGSFQLALNKQIEKLYFIGIPVELLELSTTGYHALRGWHICNVGDIVSYGKEKIKSVLDARDFETLERKFKDFGLIMEKKHRRIRCFFS